MTRLSTLAYYRLPALALRVTVELYWCRRTGFRPWLALRILRRQHEERQGMNRRGGWIRLIHPALNSKCKCIENGDIDFLARARRRDQDSRSFPCSVVSGRRRGRVRLSSASVSLAPRCRRACCYSLAEFVSTLWTCIEYRRSFIRTPHL